jgi:methyl-accepting chemotaxis protein
VGTVVAGWSAYGWYTLIWAALLLGAAAWLTRDTGFGTASATGDNAMIDDYLDGARTLRRRGAAGVVPPH